MDAQPFVSLRGLAKVYGKGDIAVSALKGVDLDIQAGEFVAIMGQSGSGKSTLMHLLGGLDTPTSGSITVGGHKLAEMHERELADYRNRTVGFVFQFFYLQPYLTVLENVEVPLVFRGENADDRRVKAQHVVDKVGLHERGRHKPGQLSGGQLQRTAIARALVGEPKLLLADEPTGNLDQMTGAEILDLLKTINRDHNTTIVMITHDPHVASQADRIIRIADGRIVV